MQDITRLIVPSAESFATFGAKQLDILVESVNEGWDNSVPFTSPSHRPQPDYSVGFERNAFTRDQLAKLSPFIGNFLFRDQSYFMATYYMYFPFLTCEVKCGSLDIADRQNTHSMTLAVRAIVELFRTVKQFDGKDKWTAYRFTKNVYDTWMPAHFENICSAIDQLPSELHFDVPPLSGATGLSQEVGSLLRSDAGSVSEPIEQDIQLSSAEQPMPTLDTSSQDQE
ncbi:hypothetical protein MAPG_08177 [Magnaporthiopsis poae ATCC 64411]|uniref:DUF7924 domain-containing protein n=1 Tax=Magnaporthiopsis poae (strain ATCC 64411 / 73-15) TaxID=644358 RepID=A0A0C4E6N3_MAGP6|nr:hypothetical protein MAPG_08177 [Magnaporthiopsis poae ATCC 64411]